MDAIQLWKKASQTWTEKRNKLEHDLQLQPVGPFLVTSDCTGQEWIPHLLVVL